MLTYTIDDANGKTVAEFKIFGETNCTIAEVVEAAAHIIDLAVEDHYILSNDSYYLSEVVATTGTYRIRVNEL